MGLTMSGFITVCTFLLFVKYHITVYLNNDRIRKKTVSGFAETALLC